MAIDWQDLFGDIGALIARCDPQGSILGSSLATDVAAIRTRFAADWGSISEVGINYDTLGESVAAWREELASLVDARISVQAVLDELGLVDPETEEIVAAIIDRMITDGQTVKGCATVVGAATARTLPANYGDGSVWTTKTLDGYSDPDTNAVANIRYLDQSSIFQRNETLILECTADSSGGEAAEGGETFAFRGKQNFNTFDAQGEGSGIGEAVTVANNHRVISNSSFDSFTNSIPNSWIQVSGSAGSNISQGTSDPYRTGNYLILRGGSGAVQLTQAPVSSAMRGAQRFHLGCAIRCSGSPTVSTKLIIGFVGTGYTAAAGSQIELFGSGIATSWQSYGCSLNTPYWIPSDWRLSIQLVDAPASFEVHIDSLSCAALVWLGGTGVAISSGRKPWAKGDRLTIATTNDNAGKFQTFARRYWGVQLPQVIASTQPFGLLLPLTLFTQGVSPTISDALVA